MNKKTAVALLVAIALVFALTSEYSISIDRSEYYVGEAVNITVTMPLKVYAVKLYITLPSNETEETPAIRCRTGLCLYQYFPDQPGHYIVGLFDRNISVEFDVLRNENETAPPLINITPTLPRLSYYDERTNLTFFYYLIPTEEGYGDLIIENITPHLPALVLNNFSLNSSLFIHAYELNISENQTILKIKNYSQNISENISTEATNITENLTENITENTSEEIALEITETKNTTEENFSEIINENNTGLNETENITENLTEIESETEIRNLYNVIFVNLSGTNFSYAEYYILLEYDTLLSCVNFTNETCALWEKANSTQDGIFAILNSTSDFLVAGQLNISYPLDISENISLNVSEENISEINITPLEDEVYKQLEIVFIDMGFDYYEDFWTYDSVEEEVQELLIQNAFFVVYDEKGEGRIPEYIISMVDEKHANVGIFKPIQSVPVITFYSLYLDKELKMSAYDINDSAFVLDTYYLFYPYGIVYAEKKGEYLYSCEDFSYDYTCRTGFKELNYTLQKGKAVFNITKEQKLFLWTEKPLTIPGGEQNATELLPSININISDTRGKQKNYTYEILEYTGRYASVTFYFSPEERIHSITLYNLSLSGEPFILLDEFSNSILLVDLSNSDFDYSVVIAKDYGGDLYKCKEFDKNYSCSGGWEKWPYFASGGYIVFKLLPEDPLFIQTINLSTVTTLNIIDPFGNPVNGSYEILDNSTGLDVQINFNSGQVLQLTIYDIPDDGYSHTIVVGDTFVNDSENNMTNTFVIDLSNISYNYSNVVARNSGGDLYKCSTFSSNFSCLSSWELYPYTNNGVNRSFNLTEGDPMFGYEKEGNISIFDITSCTAITTSGYHTLDNNLVGNTSNSIGGYYYCIAIRVSNVELNCQNYEIRGNSAGSTVGIIIYDPPLAINPLTNVTVRNCNVLNYSRNLMIDSALTTDHSQITIRDSRFNLSSGNSIRVEDCDDSNFTNLVVDRTSDGGILFLTDSTNNRVVNFTGYNSANFFIMDYSGSNNFTNITLRNGGWAGIWIRGVDNSIVDGFDIQNITESGGVVYGGIYVSSGGDNNIIRNGKIYDLVTYGIQVNGSYNNTITNVTIYNSTSESGIFIYEDTADNNKIYNSTIYRNADYGIYVNGADDLLIYNTNIENHTSGYEVYLYAPSSLVSVSNILIQNSRFVNNKSINTMGINAIYGSNITVDNSTFTGIYIGAYFNQSNTITIKNSTFLRNGKAGIFFDSTTSSSVLDNDINDTYWTSDDPGGIYLGFCDWNSVNFYKFEGGIILCYSNYTQISYNYLKGNGTCTDNCIANHNGCEAGIFTYNSKLNNITYNIFRNSGDNYDSLYFYSYDTNYWYNDQNGTDPLTGNNNVNDGIKLDNSRGFNISHSNFSNNREWGIFLTNSNDTYIYNNTASYNTNVGIRLASSANNTVIYNTAFKNQQGFRVEQLEAINNIFKDNTAYSNSYYGFYLYFSSNNTLSNNTAYSNSYYGFYLYFSSNNNTLSNNTAYSNSYYGFCLYFSSNNNILSNNTAYNNNIYGIYLYQNADNNTIVNNTIYNNSIYQLLINETYPSYDNKIYNNIFNASAGQGVVYDSGTNYWNTSYDCTGTNIIGGDCIGGNFYSNYTGADDGSGATYPHNIAGDGIGDNPDDYYIYGGSNIDYLPLTNLRTACFYADTSNTVYTLTRNLYGNKSDRICITINASNITIDCNGYNITGTYPYTGYTIGIGNYDSRNNVTIKNCYITNYTFGIYANLSNQYNITNNSLVANGKAGIFFDSTENSTIWDNDINDTYWTSDDPGGDYFQFCNWSAGNFSRFEGGIILCSSNYTQISYNYLKGNGTCGGGGPGCGSNHNGCEAGIFTYNSKLNNVTHNTFRNSGDNYDSLYFYSYDTNYWYNDQNGTDPLTGNKNVNDGIKLDHSRGFNISHSNFSNNYEWGIFFTWSNDSYIYNNTARYCVGSGGVGIRLARSANNTVIYNTAFKNQEGFRVDYSEAINNILKDNTAYNNSWYGFHLSSSSNNTLSNNTAYSNSYYGFHLYFSSNNTLSNNTAYNNNIYGIYLYQNADNNTIVNNTIYNNSIYQLLINETYPSYDNKIYNNIFNASAGQGVVYDSGTNYWNISYDCTGTNIIGGDCIGGNFYSNYTGVDDGSGATYPHNIYGDGIGDNPDDYYIYGGSNVDYLPLTNNQTLCFYADTSNTVYTLTRNLYGNKSDGNCITIVDWTTNITIDCNGYNITGWGVGKGIFSAYSSHNTIKNCNIRNYTYAMDLRVGQNISVFNNNITNNTNGIALIVDIKHSRLYNNYFYDNTGSSFYMVYGCDNVSFYNNTIEKSGGWAISLRDTTTNSRIENNTIFNGDNVGIGLYPSDTLNNTIKGNSIYNQGSYGIYLSSGTNNNTISDNIVYNTTNYQIAISSSSDNLIYNNIFNASAGQGVVYDSGTNYWNISYDCTGTNIIGGDCIGGNFYSNYTGVDDGSGATYPHNIYGDGIGDNPPNYSIYGGSNWDYLPLTNNITYARCFYANISNTVYTLSGNLYGNKSDRICITINASNITIDCNGYNITGNHSLTENTIGIGSYVGWENVTIQGCHVSNYTYGVYAYSFNNTLIDELNSIRNHFGIYLNQTTNSNITNSKIEVYNETAWSRGIYLVNSSGIRISSSHINRTGLTSAPWAIGIMPCATNDTIIESSNFTDRLTRSIFVSICREVDGTEFQAPTYNLTIKDNHFWNTETVIALWVNYNTSIINNTIEYYRGYGIVSGYLGLPGEYWDLLIENNTIRNATNCLDDPSYSGHMTGIYIDTNSGGWTVRGNRIEYMPTLGIDLDGVGGYSYDMLFENNVFNHTGENDYGAGCNPTPNMGGVYFGGIENSTVQNNIVENFGSSIGINFWWRENQNVLVQNNTVFNGNATGIGGSGTQNNITVRNNTVSFARAGIGFSSTSNSAFYNNTVHDNTKEGIAISNGYNNTLQDNLAYANMYGISLNNVVNHTLLNNNMTNNRYNFYIEGSSVPHFVHNITTDNIVRDTVLDSSDKYIYYYVRNVTGDGLYDTTEPIPTNVGFIGVVNSSDFLVENVSLHNNSHGLLSVLANNVTANNATFYYEYIGAYLLYSSNHNITNLNSSSNGAGGFRLYYSDKNNITDSEIKNNGLFGVDLRYTNNTIVENNQIHNNSYYGFRGYASSYSNKIINNTIGSFHNISIYLNNAPYTLIENNTIYESNIDGIHLFMNSNCNIINNSITSNTQYGVSIHYQSSNNTILYNTITNNGYSGLYILISVNNTIAGNTISDNTQNGIYLFGYANENNITNNTISDNFFNGIRIEAGCSNNLIYNNILNNTYNTYDDGTNYWNYSYCPGGPNIIGGQCIGGNYYSDYDGIDDGSGSPPIHNIAGDGIGDNPDQYAIGGGSNIDYMPLTNNQLGMNCMYINSNTSLLANLVGNKSDRACITFNASNIYLNCSGYNITGNVYDPENKTYAIMTNGFENISIINCPNLTNYSFGIYVNGTKNATINNVTSYKNTDSGIGIVDNSSQIEISNTTLPFNTENGIFINSSSQVNVYSTEIYNNPYSTLFNVGIYSLNSSRILISNASIYNHSTYGILAYDTSHISISDSYSIFNQIAGMYLNAGNNLTMQNSNFSNNTIYGIRLNAFENITGNNITIHGTRGDEAFLADYSYNATISNSSISFNYLNAIRLFTSANFTFNNITANNNTRGIYINDYTNGTRILNSNISFNSDKGVFFTQTTDNNRMENSYICFNTQKDIDNQDGTDNNGSLNTCDTYYQWKDDELPDGCAMTCTSIWHYFYGNITGLILLGTNWTEPKFMSNWTPAIVHMYVFPEGNTISWLELQALGRKADNTTASNDFEEADIALGIDPALVDSINKTFSIDGTLPIENTTYRVWGRDIANISIANSTDNKNFKTGILWDTSDGGTEFTSAEHQDLVFMTNITWDGEGKWGTYDYEIRVPSQFATYNGGAGRVIIYLEVQ